MKDMSKKTMTKRHSPHSHGWLKGSILLASVTATLIGAQWLQWAERSAAADPANGVIATAQSAAGEPASSNVRSPDSFTVALPPVPTLSAAPVRAAVRPVARTRSSR